jgi:hypothetical protein
MKTWKDYPLNNNCSGCGVRLKHYKSIKCPSCSRRGRKMPPITQEHRDKIAAANRRRIYKPHTQQTKDKIKLAKEKYLDCIIEHPTLLRREISNRTCYKEWRENVLRNSNFVCSSCLVNRATDAHHKIKFVDIIKTLGVNTLRKAIDCLFLWDTNNGIALCKQCHKKEHKCE